MARGLRAESRRGRRPCSEASMEWFARPACHRAVLPPGTCCPGRESAFVGNRGVVPARGAGHCGPGDEHFGPVRALLKPALTWFSQHLDAELTVLDTEMAQSE